MRRKLIAVDLDDVLADSAVKFVAYSNKKWGTTLEVDDFSEHWAEMWGISIDETLQRRDHIYQEKVQTKLDSFIDAKEVLSELAHTYDLIIVTSRPLVLQKDTIAWIEQYYGGIFKEVYFAGIWDGEHDVETAVKLNKGDRIKELGADYFIDDHPKHCLAVAKYGIPSLLFGDYGWNRHIVEQKNLLRVADWKAVKEFFDGQN